MLCSEIHRQSLAREEAPRVDLILSSGSEALFKDDVASNFSLKAAQYRAAENNIPLIRANILGPSAIIAPDGSLIARTYSGSAEILEGAIRIQDRHTTPFSAAGNAPLVIGLAMIFAVAWTAKRHER